MTRQVKKPSATVFLFNYALCFCHKDELLMFNSTIMFFKGKIK